ncbi:MAE_28990/MAE_18760 family HEPN-like nuclease [Acinetobacter indicus]|uniref:MAE_28990/MAE_18760 family HEPN-like nuclease n=1 Tax=Acinetobacter indicus TaxID=756892 RepID=UPI0034CEB8CC
MSADIFDEFETDVYEDLRWRKSEIQNFFTELKYPDVDIVSQQILEKAIRKSLILLIYSHWEGFIKRGSKRYLKYIVDKKVPLKDLQDCFKILAMKGNFVSVSSEIRQSEKESFSFDIYKKVVEDYNDKLTKVFFLNIDMNKEKDGSIIDTAGNLKAEIFKKIYNCLGIPFYKCLEENPEIDFIETSGRDCNLITQILDKTLLISRNHIAHGNKHNVLTLLEMDRLEALKNLIFTLMDKFVDDILSFAENEFYLANNLSSAKSHIELQNEDLKENLTDIISLYIRSLSETEESVD